MTSVAGGAAVVGEGAAPRSCGLGKGGDRGWRDTWTRREDVISVVYACLDPSLSVALVAVKSLPVVARAIRVFSINYEDTGRTRGGRAGDRCRSTVSG